MYAVCELTTKRSYPPTPRASKWDSYPLVEKNYLRFGLVLSMHAHTPELTIEWSCWGLRGRVGTVLVVAEGGRKLPPTMAIQRSHPTVEAQEQYNLGWQDGNEGCACVSGALIMLRGCDATA